MRYSSIHLGRKSVFGTTVAAAVIAAIASTSVALAQGNSVSVAAKPSVLAAATIPNAAASISRVGTVGETLHVIVGHSVFLNTKFRLRKIFVTDPNILTTYTMSPNQLIVTAMVPGTSSLILQDENGQAQSYVVSSDVDVDGLRVAMSEAMRSDAVRVDGAGGRVILSGTVTSDALSDTAVKLATLYSKDVANSLIVTPSRAKQVRLKVRIIEVDRSKATQFGINLFNPSGSNNGNSTTGQFPSTATASTATTGTQTLSVSDPLNFLFYNYKYNVGATIKDLESKQVLQILAEPTITTISGQKANFLAGGEFPFPVIQPGGGSGSTASVTIVFRPYGVKLEFTPIVHEDGSILLKVAPEVSALDYTNSVTISGYTIPALATRRAETQVELRSDQSFAISGLLDKRITDVYERNPGAASIPIIGALFKSKSINHTNTELIVIVTPTLVDPLTDNTDPETPKMPVPALNSNDFDNSLHHKYSADTRSGAGSTLEAEPHKGADPAEAPRVAPAAKAANVSSATAAISEPQGAAPQSMEPSTTVVIPASATSATLSPTAFITTQNAAKPQEPATSLYVSAPAPMPVTEAQALPVAKPVVLFETEGSRSDLALALVPVPRLEPSPVAVSIAEPLPAYKEIKKVTGSSAAAVSPATMPVAHQSNAEVSKVASVSAVAPPSSGRVGTSESVSPSNLVEERNRNVHAAEMSDAGTAPVSDLAALPRTSSPKASIEEANLVAPSEAKKATISSVPEVPAQAGDIAVVTAHPSASSIPAPSDPAPAAVGHPTPVVKPAMVQVMAISHAEDAEAMVASLKRHGYEVAVRQDPRDSLLHLQMGPYPSRTDAEEIRQKLLSEGYNATISVNQ